MPTNIPMKCACLYIFTFQSFFFFSFPERCIMAWDKNVSCRTLLLELNRMFFMKSQEWGIGAPGMKKVEEKAMRREAAGRRSALLWAGGMEDRQGLRAGGRSEWGTPTGLPQWRARDHCSDANTVACWCSPVHQDLPAVNCHGYLLQTPSPVQK